MARRAKRGRKSKRGTRCVTVKVLVSGGGSGRSYRKRGKSKKRRGGYRTSKSGRVYARTKSGRFKHVASRIGGRQHRKARRRGRRR